MTIVDRQGHVVTQGAFNHCMAALDEARGRSKQLSEDWDALASRMQTMRKAAQLYREASIQDHAAHWDSKQTGGANCPACLRASELRREADALVDIANAPRERTAVAGTLDGVVGGPHG